MRWASLAQVYDVIASHDGVTVQELTRLLYPDLEGGMFFTARYDTASRLSRLKKAGRIVGTEYRPRRMIWRVAA